MFEKSNIMKGYKNQDELKKLKDEEPEEEDANAKHFKLPTAMFEDFEEIDHNNEEMFEFVAYHVAINYLEQACLKKGLDHPEEERLKLIAWNTALEFPICIASAGRSMLHEVANYFNLSHHSRGGKSGRAGKAANKNR
jgi:hypothetical protein